MNRTGEIETAAELAAEMFGNGYHCAEAVVAGIMKATEMDNKELIPCATAFGGGIGETFTEACGVISGSMLIIGNLHGRTQQGESWSEAATLGREVLQGFVKLHGTANCGELRKQFGTEKQMDLCRELVRHGTKKLLTVLNEQSVRTEDRGQRTEISLKQ